MGKVVKRKKIGFLICIAISAFCSVGIVGLFKLKYFCPDDALLNYIAMGAWGANSSFLIFINVLIGYLITYLYYIFPSVNCYALFMLGVEMVAFGGVLFTVWRYSHVKVKGFFIVLIALLEVFVSCNYTYTILAAIITVIGISLLLFGILYGSFGLRFWGTIFTWIGFMIRMPSFLIGGCICVPLVIFVCREKLNRTIFLKHFLLILALCTWSWLLNNYAYEKSEIWSLQKERLEYRLVDYSKLDYVTHEAELQEIGLSENDLECYYSWIFADLDTFSIDNLRAMDQLLSFDKKYNVNIKLLLKQMLNFKYNYYFATIILICFFAYYLIVKGKVDKKQVIYLVGIIFITYFAILGLFIRQRTPDNVVYMVFCSGFLSYLSFICLTENNVNNEKNEKLICKIIIGIGIILGAIYIEKISIESQQICMESKEKTEEVIKWQKDNPDILIAGTVGPQNTFFNKPILKLDKDVFFMNRVKLGTWDMGSERWYSQISCFNVDPEKLLIEIADKENVALLISDQSELEKIKKYIEEHTKKGVKMKLLQKFSKSGWQIVQLSFEKRSS